MELQGEDGSCVNLPEALPKELGRGPGLYPHDLSVSRRHVRFLLPSLPDPSVGLLLEVLGPNPCCVLRGSVERAFGELEIVKPGTSTSLQLGDQVSLSIQDPMFYTLRRPRHLSPHESPDSRNLQERKQGVEPGDKKKEQGFVAADEEKDEEEGIAEAVARWQRRKEERLQGIQRKNSGILLEDGSELVLERVQQELDDERDVAQGDEETEDSERGPTGNEEDAEIAKKFGFIVEGSEFERYGKKGLDSRPWDWRIGRQPGSDDDDEGEELNGTAARGSRTKQKAKRKNEDDDDDWQVDNAGENGLLSARGRRPMPRKRRGVNTRSQNLASTSETLVDPSTEQVDTKARGEGTTSASTKKISKRKPRSSQSEEEEDLDDDEEDLEGFVVDDADEEEEEEVEDEEDEWTDEEDEIEDDDEIEEDSARAPAHAPGSQLVDDGDGDKPLCQYGKNCFRKNKDHLAEFRH